MLGTALTILISLLFPSILHSATFFVSNVSQLESALATAENNGEHDIINMASDTYSLTTSLSYDNFDTNEDKSITLQGTGGYAVLDGSGLNSRVLFIRNSNADIAIYHRRGRFTGHSEGSVLEYIPQSHSGG